MKQNATFDSSFWINAHRAGLTAEVLNRYRLHFSTMVAAELRPSYASGREFWRLVEAGVISPAMPAPEQVRDFGAGERAAINLSLHHPDWVLLIDDQRPLQAAVGLGLQVVCTRC